MLDLIETTVRSAGFEPILADNFELLSGDLDVHDVTLYLLHSCRLAVFELTTLSGALMELERCPDYGINHALVLYRDPYNRQWSSQTDAWETTAMVKSFVREHRKRFKVRPYVRPHDAQTETQQFLRAIRRSVYGRLHNL